MPADEFDLNELPPIEVDPVLDVETLSGLARESWARVGRFIHAEDWDAAFWEVDLLQHYVRRIDRTLKGDQ